MGGRDEKRVGGGRHRMTINYRFGDRGFPPVLAL